MLTVVAVLTVWTAGSVALALVVGGIVRLREHDAHCPQESRGTHLSTIARDARLGSPAPVG